MSSARHGHITLAHSIQAAVSDVIRVALLALVDLTTLGHHTMVILQFGQQGMSSEWTGLPANRRRIATRWRENILQCAAGCWRYQLRLCHKRKYRTSAYTPPQIKIIVFTIQTKCHYNNAWIFFCLLLHTSTFTTNRLLHRWCGRKKRTSVWLNPDWSRFARTLQLIAIYPLFVSRNLSQVKLDTRSTNDSNKLTEVLPWLPFSRR